MDFRFWIKNYCGSWAALLYETLPRTWVEQIQNPSAIAQSSRAPAQVHNPKLIALAHKGTRAGLFHSHLARLRINSESNSESRLKTTEKSITYAKS
ncbi:hypothetical protein LC605_08855 [Nostoc sp. CHAB 5836]|uniref:hypothetical protein n=1 Tax=Nostoc sp. CHAB 5836 TaxID=2780404 RepID=UPI001E3C2A82|nr:hypothetical protein [Nostoc sp. CHAB 5836]MCC5615182.1 hypothetical protein [Nostoc sp. CHAB 5836]